MVLKRNVRGGKPSPYPRIPFHALRSAQLLSSIVVSGIMCYFMYYLHKEHYSIPWTFIVLLAVSLATVAMLTVTIILYNYRYLSPRFNLTLNGSLSLIWALGLGLLSWSVSSSHVLERACTGQVWGGIAQAGVCRDYKALWSMTLVGTVSTFGALFLDLHTFRKETRQGKYNLPEDDKDAQRLKDLKGTRVRNTGYASPNEDHMPRESVFDQDIGYHSRYGNEDDQLEATSLNGPLEDDHHQPQHDMGYHNQFFRD